MQQNVKLKHKQISNKINKTKTRTKSNNIKRHSADYLFIYGRSFAFILGRTVHFIRNKKYHISRIPKNIRTEYYSK